MLPSSVRLEQAGTVLELSPGTGGYEIVEGKALGFIHATSKPTVYLDDAPVSVSWDHGAKLAVWGVDLTNQVGFHRLEIQIAGATYTYDFRTRTTKATWDEVRSMAEVCVNSYLGYKRQFTYMAANGAARMVRLPQVHYGWLRDRLPEIERLVRSINARPASSSVQTTHVSRRSKGLSVARTSRLLREKHHLLECSEGGPIQIAEADYWPSRVVIHAKERRSQLDEHVYIATFLKALEVQCQDLANVVVPTVKDEVEKFVELVKILRCLPVFRDIMIRPGARPTSVLPTIIQRSDRRYGRMRDLQSEYGADIADSMDYNRSIRANVRDVWEVYQTFVAHVIGNALGLAYFSPDKDLRKRSPQGWSMHSHDWRLYFDTKPPRDVVSSWRDKTTRPADERPDILLISSNANRILVLDAKFKIDSVASRATQTDLFEMQGYLNSFGAKSGGIIFPGEDAIANLIVASGNALLELPIRASQFRNEGGVDTVHQYVREALGLINI